MKPDWSSAPAWAKFLAMDSDGYWYWHAGAPKFENDYWYPQFEQANESPDCSGIDWDFAYSTLEARPDSYGTPPEVPRES